MTAPRKRSRRRERERTPERLGDMMTVTAENPAVRIAATGLDFDDFYVATRTDVAKALTLALRDRSLAEEATDEAMTRAYASWGKVGSMDNPKGWVYRVALNWATSVLRRRTRFSKLKVVQATEVVDDLPEFELSAAVADLPIDQRSVVICRFYLDWSVQETAQALGVRPGTVQSRLHRALKRLEANLDQGDQA